MKETEIMKRIRAALNMPGGLVRMWRNNVGSLPAPGGLGRITFGLAKGSADLIGIRQVTITPEMVGMKLGQFVAVEVKTPSGRLSDEQKAWLETVRRFGGVAVVARSVEEAKKAVG